MKDRQVARHLRQANRNHQRMLRGTQPRFKEPRERRAPLRAWLVSKLERREVVMAPSNGRDQ